MRFSELDLRTKIGLGYFAVGLLLTLTVLTSLWQARSIRDITERVTNLRTPTAMASLALMNGMNHSLAALRGWMLLGEDKFKSQRAFAWANEIRPSISNLAELSAHWNSNENRSRLMEIERLVADFDAAQSEIETIAHDAKNLPAVRLLNEKAKPLTDTIGTNITKLIDLELTQPGTPERKALLGMMADVRGTTGLAVAKLQAYLISGDTSNIRQFDDLWAKNQKRFLDLQSRAAMLTPEQKTAFAELTTARSAFLPLPAELIRIRGSDEWNIANKLLSTKAAPIATKIQDLIEAMVGSQRELLASDSGQSKRLAFNMLVLQWALLITGIIMCALIGMSVTMMVTRPINEVITILSDSATQVGDASNQLSEASVSLAQGASNGASSVQEASAAMEEFAAMVRSNAASAREVSLQAKQSTSAAQEGTAAVGSLIDTMTRIVSSSQQIQEATAVIDDIAFQTNLLALNAAVEAARAGELGKGFAVVADAVRGLSQKSAEAAKNISTRISLNSEYTQQGSQLAETTRQRLSDILNRSNEVATLIERIDQGSRQQETAISQITQTISQIDQTTQRIAATAEESASAATQLAAQASALNRPVEGLKALAHGSKIYDISPRPSEPNPSEGT
jgi:methyl-accepting chemotaxis protein